MIRPPMDRMIHATGLLVRPRGCSMIERIDTEHRDEVLRVRKLLAESAEAEAAAEAEVTPAPPIYGTRSWT